MISSSEGLDLFPGFESHRIDVGGATIFARAGGAGLPLLLLHGYPQTHAMWHRIAPALGEKFMCVVPDLRGYGESSMPASTADHGPYSKRAMARDMISLMTALGHRRFAVAGHDRGGRVAYRMALDTPAAVSALAVLDILPTHAMWADFNRQRAMKTYHWAFLAQPEPLPERLIANDPDFYLDWTLSSWTQDRSLKAFDPRALAAYRKNFRAAGRIHAACEDYRAGVTCDLAADQADRDAGRQIECPVLALFGAAGIPDSTSVSVWQEWAPKVQAETIPSGHFLCEENPGATLKSLQSFFERQI